MKVAEKYKQTEVGIIPSDWEVKELGEICQPSKARINPITSSTNYKCIELEHLAQGSGILLGYANSNELKSQKSIFVKGDVLFGKLRPYLRKYYLADFDGVCTTEIWVLKTEKEISNGFLYQLVQSDRIIEAANLSTGTKMPRAEWKTVSETKIPVPTKAEQCAIATALSDADALISSVEKLIAKKRMIKQGAMQQLLQPKEGWEVKILGESSVIARGGSPRPIEDYLTTQPDGINWIKIGDVGKGAKYIETTEEKIKPEGISRSRYVKEGDFLLSNSMSFGRPYILKTNGCIHDGWLVIQNYADNFDSDFLYYVLSSEFVHNQYLAMASGSSVLNLNKEIVKKVKINCPKKKEEQTRIATILSDMDAEIAALETKLEKYRKVKLGMMQNLLTGKIRLNQDLQDSGIDRIKNEVV
ncbi:MAG: restriction endonuclease subunit S [Bacteroidia bacterium]|nr:restriction endonuclease subunit S [Bacteroidia bacterium]